MPPGGFCPPRPMGASLRPGLEAIVKWYKHLTGSLNSSDIFEAIEKFGSDGYLVFFGTLELMADEFDPENPGICRISTKKLTKNLQLSRQKTIKILKYFHEKERIFLEDHGDVLILNCPRLAKLSDEYTERQLKKMSGQAPDLDRDKLRPIEAEAEVEEDINNPNEIVGEEKKEGKKEKKKSSSVIKFDPEQKKFLSIPEDIKRKWKEVAPGINISDEIKKAELWLMSNPDKHRSQWTAFLSKWMVRAQEHYIKYGGNNGKGIRTARSDPRSTALQSREDAEVALLVAQYEAAKAVPAGKADRDAGTDDAKDYDQP